MMGDDELCSYCRLDPASGPDGYCDDCREIMAEIEREERSLFEGAICTRCGAGLDGEGYCENDRCPFNGARQDNLPEPWSYPDEDEWEYIRGLIERRSRE